MNYNISTKDRHLNATLLALSTKYRQYKGANVTKPKATLSGTIRKRLPDIEAKMYEGIRQATIVEELVEEGFTVSLKDFRQLLYRARKRKLNTPNTKIKYGEKEALHNDVKIADKKIKEKKVSSDKKASMKYIKDMLNSDFSID